MSEVQLKAFQRRIGVRFRSRALLEVALTHRSYANEHGLDEHYERLEFLGDAVVGLVASEWLFSEHPDMPEGGMSELKAYLVSGTVLAGRATELGLGEVLRLGIGEERSGGRSKPSLLSDSMESLIGALFLDRGLKAARKVLVSMFQSALHERQGEDWPDAKTRLQELTQARAWDLPEYRHVAQEGPDHRKRFTVECWVAASLTATAAGRSKKIAEQRAAAAALEALRTDSED